MSAELGLRNVITPQIGVGGARRTLADDIASRHRANAREAAQVRSQIPEIVRNAAKRGRDVGMITIQFADRIGPLGVPTIPKRHVAPAKPASAMRDFVGLASPIESGDMGFNATRAASRASAAMVQKTYHFTDMMLAGQKYTLDTLA